jgi:hypothetical protein
VILRLQCVTSHPHTPALAPGDTFAVSLTPSGPAVILPITPRALAQIVQAMNDGALQELSPAPTAGEVLAFVEARLLELDQGAGDSLPAQVALAG